MPAHVFCMRFTSTRRGVRLARHLAAERLDTWGLPYDNETAQAAQLIVGELCANAVRHGCIAGRDFELQISVMDWNLRIEVSDARDEQYPPQCAQPPAEMRESGYGLLLVANLATHWGTLPRHPIGKTVWAEIECRSAFGQQAE